MEQLSVQGPGFVICRITFSYLEKHADASLHSARSFAETNRSSSGNVPGGFFFAEYCQGRKFAKYDTRWIHLSHSRVGRLQDIPCQSRGWLGDAIWNADSMPQGGISEFHHVVTQHYIANGILQECQTTFWWKWTVQTSVSSCSNREMKSAYKRGSYCVMYREWNFKKSMIDSM